MLGRGAGKDGTVALPTEGVDRNKNMIAAVAAYLEVALPTEGVDRNPMAEDIAPALLVALPTEGVDRNTMYLVDVYAVRGRPPHGGRG